jgi:cyclase
MKFKSPIYIGDPINAVRIFSDFQADELVFLDIDASSRKRDINFNRIRKISDEAFIPFSYGGGISSADQASRVIKNGAEKVIINTAAIENPELIKEISRRSGQQSVIVSIDYKYNMFGKPLVYIRGGKKKTGLSPCQAAKISVKQGAGEILLCNIDREGTYLGYDKNMINSVASKIDVPVIGLGGASGLVDMVSITTDGRASAAAAGSFFSFKGRRKGILINYPEIEEIHREFWSKN